MYTEFGKAMRAIREERQMTLEEMAAFLDTTKQALSRYERCERTPKITVAAKFAEKLGVALEDLIGYEPQLEDPQAVYDREGRLSSEDIDVLEALHQDPRLRMLFDRSRKMSDSDKEKMLQIADVILGELDR